MSLADRLAKSQQKDRMSEVRVKVQERLVEVLGPRLYDSTLSDNELEGLVHQRLRELLDEEEGPLSAQEKLLIVRQIGDSVLGLGPLEPYVRDPEVTEIMVNKWDTIYVERAGKLYWTGTKFHDEQQLRRTIDKIVGKVGRRVDEASPYVDARLPDGSRVNAVIPPLAIDGPALTIRKFSADPYQADDLVEFGTMSSVDGQVPGRLRPRPHQHHGVRWNRRRQDDDLERAELVHPRRRAHHHDRGRGRAQAAAAARGSPRGSPAEHRGQGAGLDPRPGPQLAAYAARPHRRR